jgi:uncharacterized protein YggU (UPF0235/DUF167 family)
MGTLWGRGSLSEGMTGNVRNIRVRVSAGVKKERIEEIGGDHFHVYVREKAEQGLANKRVAEILQDFFGTRSIHMVHGGRQQSKIFEVRT